MVPHVAIPGLEVEFKRVPVMLEQLGPLVNEIAPEQLSFAGGAVVLEVMHILKPATPPVPDGFVVLATLT